MSKIDFTQAYALRNSMRQELSMYLPEWELAARFVSPQRFRKPGARLGARKDHAIINGQAGLSLRTFQSGMSNGATPRSRPWFNLVSANKAKASSTLIKRFLSERQQLLNEKFQKSNLYTVLPLAYKDVGVFSNSAFAMLPHATMGFYFYPYAVGTYAFACDALGDTNMFTRDFTMSVQQVVKEFGKLTPSGHIDWTTLPAWVQNEWKAVRYLSTMTMSQLMIPNASYDPRRVNPFDQTTKKFQAYTWAQSFGANNIPPQSSSGFRSEQSLNPDQFLKISGYSYFPVITPRWEVQAEENYGVDGPTQMALSDVMALQTKEKFRLEAIAKLVKPPMVGHASLRRHQASILAGGITYVDDAGAQAGFKPAYEMDPKLSELLQTIEQDTARIKECYFEHLFSMFSSGEQKTHVTTVEIQEKAGEKMSALSPVVAQLDRDVLTKVIENGQIMLEEARMIPLRPQELMGENLAPEYISILAQAQKVSMLASMERGINFVTSVANATQDKNILRLIKAEEFTREYLDFVAIDPKFVADEAEYKEIQAQGAANDKAQLDAQNQKTEAETLKTLSQAEFGKNSALDTMAPEAGI